MSVHVPRVSIGLPVCNGEKYLEAALDSILAQTYTDFELIISDNASTDGTEEICRTYAARDHRVRYYRNEENRGLAWNHNNVFALSTAEYFLWIGHDDVLTAEYLERCVAVLDQNPSIVLCYSQAQGIDEHGRFVDKPNYSLATDSMKPHQRFHDLICTGHSCLAIYGVMRTEVLKKTVLHGFYPGSDRVLLAQLGLLGRFHQIPQNLFFRRDHPLKSTRITQTLAARMALFDPQKARTLVFPRWRLFGGFFSCIRQAPISRAEQLLCYIQLVKSLKKWGREMKNDVVAAIARPLHAHARLALFASKVKTQITGREFPASGQK
jgi:glycosyltransferase involved in cell wall biosynthesis